jgi:ribosomal protein S18 acetylase RimI-like enzyme
MHSFDPNVIESVQQLQEMWGKLVTDYGSGDVTDGEISVRWADTKFGFYNCLLFAQPGVGTERLTDQLTLAANYMRGKSNAGFLWLFKELLTKDAADMLDVAIEQAGLTYAMPCWGMAGDVLPFPEPIHPALRFERVASVAHLETYADLNARAYCMSSPEAQDALRGSRLFCDTMYAYIAYVGDRPVACASTCAVDGRLFVALVATDPADQRRGFGEAVTRKAIYEGGKATGLRRAALHATALGRPVYERIGLHVTSEMALYSLSVSGTD